jgi:hypothetical protein
LAAEQLAADPRLTQFLEDPELRVQAAHRAVQVQLQARNTKAVVNRLLQLAARAAEAVGTAAAQAHRAATSQVQAEADRVTTAAPASLAEAQLLVAA